MSEVYEKLYFNLLAQVAQALCCVLNLESQSLYGEF